MPHPRNVDAGDADHQASTRTEPQCLVHGRRRQPAREAGAVAGWRPPMGKLFMTEPLPAPYPLLWASVCKSSGLAYVMGRISGTGELNYRKVCICRDRCDRHHVFSKGPPEFVTASNDREDGLANRDLPAAAGEVCGYECH